MKWTTKCRDTVRTAGDQWLNDEGWAARHDMLLTNHSGPRRLISSSAVSLLVMATLQTHRISECYLPALKLGVVAATAQLKINCFDVTEDCISKCRRCVYVFKLFYSNEKVRQTLKELDTLRCKPIGRQSNWPSCNPTPSSVGGRLTGRVLA